MKSWFTTTHLRVCGLNSFNHYCLLRNFSEIPSAWDWWTPGDQQKITQRVNASLPQHACDNGRKCWKKLISAGCHMTFGHIHSWTITLFQSNIVSVSTIIYILVCTVLLWNYRWLVVWNAAIPFEMRIPIDEDMFHGYWNYERDDYTPWLSPLYPSIIPLYPRGFLWIISHEHHKPHSMPLYRHIHFKSHTSSEGIP